MKIRNLLLISLAAISLFACKKDDDDDTLSFSGKMAFKIPEYVSPKDVYKYNVDTLSTLKTEDGRGIGYYFNFTAYSLRDTVKKESEANAREYKLVIPDSLGTFTMYLYAYAKDYSMSVTSSTFSVIKPGYGEGYSLTGFDIKATDKTFKDTRDNTEYYITGTDKTEWLRNNLAWKGAGVAYNNAPVMSSVYGRYYSWNEAKTACPGGWTLPTEADWVELATYNKVEAKPYETISSFAGTLMENVYFNGSAMWPFERYVRINNSARFSAIPAGYALLGGTDPTFKDVNSYAVFWCADESGDLAYCRYIFKEQDYLYTGLRDKKSFAASVRCVRKVTAN